MNDVTDFVKGKVGSFYKRYVREFIARRPARIQGVILGAEDQKTTVIDEFVPGVKPSEFTHPPEHKRENTIAINKYVRTEDDVVVVGGGYGITSVTAAREVGPDGSITIYEGAQKYCKSLKQTVKLNDVSDRTTVEHAIIGEAIILKDDPGEATQVHPGDLPACDVLEMDCEGAELGIVKNIEQSPRTLIVETHPREGAPTNMVVDAMKEQEYEIVETIPDRIAGDVVVAERL